MYKNKTFLSIIPARSGSKRAPNKNTRILHNKPLIAWSIEASQKSQYIDTTLVTTDMPTIKNVAKKYGAYTPFLRPIELAKDESSSVDVVLHAIEYMEKVEGKVYDYAVLLQPTSPFRDNVDIDDAIKFLYKKKADAIISVCEVEHNPLWSNTLSKDKSMKNFLSDKYTNKRGQDLDTYYRLNGAIYICHIQKLKEKNTFFLDNNIYAYEMPQIRSIDIDTQLDFDIAEALCNKIKK